MRWRFDVLLFLGGVEVPTEVFHLLDDHTAQLWEIACPRAPHAAPGPSSTPTTREARATNQVGSQLPSPPQLPPATSPPPCAAAASRTSSDATYCPPPPVIRLDAGPNQPHSNAPLHLPPTARNLLPPPLLLPRVTSGCDVENDDLPHVLSGVATQGMLRCDFPGAIKHLSGSLPHPNVMSESQVVNAEILPFPGAQDLLRRKEASKPIVHEFEPLLHLAVSKDVPDAAVSSRCPAPHTIPLRSKQPAAPRSRDPRTGQRQERETDAAAVACSAARQSSERPGIRQIEH